MEDDENSPGPCGGKERLMKILIVEDEKPLAERSEERRVGKEC